MDHCDLRRTERRTWVTLFAFYNGAKKMRWFYICPDDEVALQSNTQFRQVSHKQGDLSFFRWQRFYPRRNFSTPRERFFGHVTMPSHTTAAFLYPTEAKVRIRSGAEVMVRRSKRSFQANIWSFVDSAYSRGLPIFPRSWPTIEPHR